ncbi:amino acid ABC transporter permease [Halofilum ochraceum]|jgi:polar amino acid transport system permease protein|uniref:amino acid ABC transporter permease n=1 Tax=Halofilum ochraceum TaxID=1611323 RepID=UPI0008DB21B2|nr:amino acid ABC transporter permease [Halofilum ochraceum]
MELQFDLANWMPQLLWGLVVTLEITALCIAMGIVFGLLLAMARLYGQRPIYWLATVYINFFRGTPILVQLFIVYYGLPSMGMDFSPFVAGVLALGLNTSAYQAEYFRGAIQSLPAGQMLAARSIGMSRAVALRWIVLPQALRLVIPPWSNELILMLKYSSIVFFATVTDLMGAGRIIAGETFRYFEVFILVALMYLAIVLLLSTGLRWLEARLRVPGLGGSGTSA